MTKLLLTCGLLLITQLATNTAHARLYKWVDDQGVTHYGEVIPPEFANKSRSKLSSEGRVMETQQVLSAEQIKAQEAQLRQQQLQEAAAQEQKRHDAALLGSYSNVSEIDTAKARSLQQIDGTISGILAQIKINQNRLTTLQAEEGQYRTNKTTPPASLLDEMRDTANRILKKRADLDKLRQERISTEARFEADKARYRKLTGTH